MSDLNPYAPPPPVDEISHTTILDPEWFEIEGKLVVVPANARLPDFCVVTGEPVAGGRRTQRILYSRPFRIALKKDVCLVSYCLSRGYLGRRWAIGITIAVLGPLILIMFWGWQSLVLSMLIPLYVLQSPWRRLKVVNSENGKFWLKGCSQTFLERCQHLAALRDSAL